MSRGMFGPLQQKQGEADGGTCADRSDDLQVKDVYGEPTSQVIQAKRILADSLLRIANACSHSGHIRHQVPMIA